MEPLNDGSGLAVPPAVEMYASCHSDFTSSLWFSLSLSCPRASAGRGGSGTLGGGGAKAPRRNHCSAAAGKWHYSVSPTSSLPSHFTVSPMGNHRVRYLAVSSTHCACLACPSEAALGRSEDALCRDSSPGKPHLCPSGSISRDASIIPFSCTAK